MNRNRFPRRTLLLSTIAWATLTAPYVIFAEETGTIAFAADLNADEESAPTESLGKGRADFILDRATLTFSWTVVYSGIETAIMGIHIHGPQRPGTNAGMLIDLAPHGFKSPVKGSVVLNEGQLEYLLAGRMYVNIHTTKYRDGELRGQIQRQRLPKPS